MWPFIAFSILLSNEWRCKWRKRSMLYFHFHFSLMEFEFDQFEFDWEFHIFLFALPPSPGLSHLRYTSITTWAYYYQLIISIIIWNISVLCDNLLHLILIHLILWIVPLLTDCMKLEKKKLIFKRIFLLLLFWRYTVFTQKGLYFCHCSTSVHQTHLFRTFSLVSQNWIHFMSVLWSRAGWSIFVNIKRRSCRVWILNFGMNSWDTLKNCSVGV